ncbi:MAG: IspD/TarI family cytidylyltransferase [Bacilli bacterium]|jgi:2-C-methyl-D-erythritol 4-phosphate cytidylyltransferase
MNYVIILAGGIGARVNAGIPKQFIVVDDKPIIVYTLEAFQEHPDIDAIVVVAVEDYLDEIWKLVKQFKLNKVKMVIAGGATGHLSTQNGVFALENIAKEDDVVIIHDAIRPIVPHPIIDDLLRVCQEKGNAVSSLAMQETVILTQDQKSGKESLDRKYVRRVQTPQAYHYGDLLDVYQTAKKKGITDSVYCNTLFIDFGHTLYFSRGFSNNVKITTTDDITLFKALKNFSEEDLI